jgi:hypothetical protein
MILARIFCNLSRILRCTESMPSDFEVSPVTEADVEDVSGFLRDTFHVDASWMPFQPSVVRWKSLVPHPLWQGSRGYLLRRAGEIVAHGCAMPTRFLYQGGEALVACVIDWAASKAVPGGGVAIYQHVSKFTDGLVGVGGSDDAQRVLPRLGFKRRQEFEAYARVTQPLRKFWETPEKSWRDAARLGRSVVRGLRPAEAAASGWSARRVERFDASVSEVAPRPGLVSATVCYRDAEILNYFLLCPAARMEGYLLLHKDRVAGYFLLAFVRGECRIAELWVASGESSDWAAAYLVAGEGRAGSQVAVGCATAVARHAADLAGFSVIGRQPIYVKDPRGKLPAELDAALGMLDTDAFYL